MLFRLSSLYEITCRLLCLSLIYLRLGARDPYFGHPLPSYPALPLLEMSSSRGSNYGESSSSESSSSSSSSTTIFDRGSCGEIAGQPSGEGRSIIIFTSFPPLVGWMTRLLCQDRLWWTSIVGAFPVACLRPTCRGSGEGTSCLMVSHWWSLPMMPTTSNLGL